MQFRFRNFRKGTSRYVDERDKSFSGHSIDRKLVLQLYDDFVCATVLWSLLLWPAAFLYLVGVPLKTAYRLYMIGINLGTLLI